MTSAREIRLFIADVDGTLVTHDKSLTARTRTAVEALGAAGIAFAIVSSRPARGLAMLIDPLAITTPVSAFNGGMIVEPDLTSVLVRRTLPLDLANDVVVQLVQARLDVWVYTAGGWFVRRRDAAYVEHEEYTIQLAPTVVSDVQGVLDGAIKIVGVSDDVARVARCETDLRGSAGDRAAIARSQPYYLDVTHRDANKGMAVRYLSATLGISLAEIASIGDMSNDVMMFDLCGLSIAMGNASPDVQRRADLVTTSNEEEGFANAVERFVLGRR